MVTRSSVAAVVLALGVVLIAGAPASSAQAGHAAATSGAKTYQTQVVKATNKQRAKRDLVRLRKQRCVQRMAVAQAKRMAKQRRIFHQDLGRVLERCHLTMAGENVAVGYKSGRAVVNKGWMHSSGHRANILQRRFRLIGLGARKAGGQWYVAQVFGRT